jgi:CubicO group peptidase (beta-lactamase class C family)
MSQSRSNDTFAALCEAIERRAAELRIPGVAVGILHHAEAHYAGFGVTSIENPLPVTPDTLFQCGSISKTFVGTVVMALVAEGALDLDTPLQTWLPEFALSDAATAGRVTLRHLLTHTGGWLGDHFNDFGFGENALDRLMHDMRDLPQLTPLGSIWSYNNIGFAAAGRAIEAVTGKPFEHVVRERVLEPLAMRRSVYFPTEVMTQRFAAGHNSMGGAPHVATPWEIGRANHPAGGLNTTVVDLLRYARCHIDNGAGVLPKKYAVLMRDKHISATSRHDMGITWWLGKLGKQRTQFIQHGGATNGFTAHLRIVPEEGFAIALLTNSDLGSQLNEAISHLALQNFPGLALDKVQALTTSAAEQRAYTGRYTAHLTEHKLRFEKGGLVLHSTALGRFPTPSSPVHGDATWSTELAFYAPDKVFAKADGLLGPRGEFIRDASGRIQWLRWGGRLHKYSRA